MGGEGRGAARVGGDSLNSQYWTGTPKESATHGHHSSAEASGRTELQNWSGLYHLPLPE